MLIQSESSINSERVTGVIVPVVVFLFFAVLSFTALWTIPDRALYDALLRVKCSVAPVDLTPRIVAVDLTDSAELNLGGTVGSRQAFIDSLRVMEKSGSSGCFDFLFAESKEPENDRLLAQTATTVPGCVFVAVPLSREETGFSGRALNEKESESIEQNLWHPHVVHAGSIPEASSFLMPYSALAERATGLAHAGLIPDSDGVERRAPLLYRWGDGYLPSIPLLLAANALGADTSRVVLDAGRCLELPIRTGSTIRIPIDRRGCMYIPYAGLWKDGLRRIPLDTFVEAERDDAVFESLYDTLDGNILCVSDLTTAKKDFGITPLEPVYPLSGVHTTVLNAILTDTFFREIPIWLLFLNISLLTIGILLASLLKSDGAFHCACAVLLACLTGESLLLWFTFGIVPRYFGACATLLAFWLSSWVIRLSASYRKRLLMEHAMSRYFPRSLAARVLKEGRTDLAPAKKELTMLFSDIAGFTRWSSDKTPETVHLFLGEYLSSMAEIIFAHGGTVDKFIGDGILAFFGDPFEQSDHASRAVSAAIDMQKKIRELAVKWKPLAEIDLRVRVGINTGDVIVGNLGSDVRIDYTVIGAAVNLASRMESNAPPGGILVAESTYEKTKKTFSFSDPQQVTAKGYDRSVQAYVVTVDFE